jgi:hypothetical protein
MDAFMMAFDSNLAPIVGQQITRTATNGAVADPRIDLLEQRADAGECDLVAKGALAGAMRGSLYVGGGQYLPDRVGDPSVGSAALRARAATAGQEVTFTCVPPGSGLRIAIDRDGDGAADGDEIDAGTDPADAGDLPTGGVPLCTSTTAVTFKRATLNDRRGALSLNAELDLDAYAQETVSLIATDPTGDIMAEAVPGTSIVLKGSTYRYKSALGGGTHGIKTLTLKEERNSGGVFKITLRTTNAWPAGEATAAAASTQIRVNVGGHCFLGTATKVQ